MTPVAFCIGLITGFAFGALLRRKPATTAIAAPSITPEQIEILRAALSQRPLNITNQLQFPDGTTLIIESGTPVNRLQ